MFKRKLSKIINFPNFPKAFFFYYHWALSTALESLSSHTAYYPTNPGIYLLNVVLGRRNNIVSSDLVQYFIYC